jgi:hypothetical protein
MIGAEQINEAMQDLLQRMADVGTPTDPDPVPVVMRDIGIDALALLEFAEATELMLRHVIRPGENEGGESVAFMTAFAVGVLVGRGQATEWSP